MKRYLVFFISLILFFAGCTFNIKEQSKEVTLSRSSIGLTKISIGNELLQENDIDIQGTKGKQVVVSAVARMLVLKESDDNLDDLQLNISINGTIGYAWPGDDWSRIRIDEISIRADKTLDCNFETISGDVKIIDMMGAHTLETVSGDVELGLGCDSLLDTMDIYITTVSGDVEINLDLYIPAFAKTIYNISIETKSGDVEITVPPNFSANLDYTTKSGDKDISSSFIDLNSAKHIIKCKTTSGDLKIETYN